MSEGFNPHKLSQQLSSLAQAPAPCAAQLAYRQFYQMDLSAQFAGLDWRLGNFAVGGYQIAAQLWRPESARGTLLLLHGYYDHMGLYRHVVEWALSRQLAVLACDLPGHGLSSGRRASIDDFAEYQAVLAGLLEQAEQLSLPAPWHLCGQSTGGAIVLEHLLSGARKAPLAQSILLAPLVRPRAWAWSKLSYQLLSPFVQDIKRRFTHNSSDPSFIDFVHNHDPLQATRLPTAWVGALKQWVPRIERSARSQHSPLIIQGEQDMTVDWQHNLDVLEDKFAAPSILRLANARHHLANEAPVLRQQYFAFLDQHLS